MTDGSGRNPIVDAAIIAAVIGGVASLGAALIQVFDEEITGIVRGDGRPDAGEEFSFVAPSGNITCTITEIEAGCAIVEIDVEKAGPGCRGLHEVVVGNDGALDCRSPTGATYPTAGLPVLEYNDSMSHHGFTCTSRRTGMSCHDHDTGHGFSIARAGIVTDPAS
ncbi:DUF6636 domain-containing protein [Myceligenerans crystallogenes]|uniref:Uncharacterized protein n=1 Tax=Myceligenerans crystallogenes TaxID=316335 RepID=A0ABN2N5P7_9MICO